MLVVYVRIIIDVFKSYDDITTNKYIFLNPQNGYIFKTIYNDFIVRFDVAFCIKNYSLLYMLFNKLGTINNTLNIIYNILNPSCTVRNLSSMYPTLIVYWGINILFYCPQKLLSLHLSFFISRLAY